MVGMPFDFAYDATGTAQVTGLGVEDQALVDAAAALVAKLPDGLDRANLEIAVAGHANAGFAHVDGWADTWLDVKVRTRSSLPPVEAPVPTPATAGIVTATGEAPDVAAEMGTGGGAETVGSGEGTSA